MVYPATISVPVRGLEWGFGKAKYVAVPLPRSDAPDVIESHGFSLTAVHEQPDGVTTVTVPTNPWRVDVTEPSES
jgi:hypothetical protein